MELAKAYPFDLPLSAEDPARYPPAEVLLGVRPDIARVFMDQDSRKLLSVDVLDAVRCRRDLKELLSKQIRECGVVMLLSILAVGQIIPDAVRERSGPAFYAALFMVSLSISLFLIFWSIRVRVR